MKDSKVLTDVICLLAQIYKKSIGSDNMNKTQIRKTRVTLKAERRKILMEIDELQIKLNDEQSPAKRKKLKNQIRRLGAKLETKVTSAVKNHKYVNSSKFQDFATGKSEPWSMPLDKYVEFKKEGKTDPQIAESIGATESQIRSWKSRNRITKELWKEAN